MKIRNTLIFSLSLVLLLLGVMATIEQQMTTGNTNENISFSTNENITKYIRLLNTSNVSTAAMDLKSDFFIAQINDDTEDTSNWTKDSGTFNGSACIDEDWDTYGSTYSASGTVTGDLYENYTIGENKESANWTFKIYYSSQAGSPNVNTLNFTCKQQSDNSWNTLLNYSQVTGELDPTNRSLNIPLTCLNGSVLELHTNLISQAVSNLADARYYEGMIIWNRGKTLDNITNPYLFVGTPDATWDWNHTNETIFNSTASVSDFSTSLQSAVDSCSPDTNGYCNVSLLFHSDTAGKIEISNINISYYADPYSIHTGGIENYTQTASPSQQLTFNITIDHDYIEDINQTSTYNFTSNTTTNFTIAFEETSILVGDESENHTKVNINVSATPTAETHSFEIKITRIENSETYIFPVTITVSSYAAEIGYISPSPWNYSDYSDTTATQTYDIVNTGSYDATNCTFRITKFGGTGNLNTYLTQNESLFTVTNTTNKSILLSIVNPAAATYSNEYLQLDCIGNVDNNTVSSTTNPELTFTISTRPSATSGGGGSSTVVESGDVILDFGTQFFTFTVIGVPKKTSKTIRVKNIGTAPFSGEILIDGVVKKYITQAKVCDLSNICSEDSIDILAGESKFLTIDANFDKTLGDGSEGILKFAGNQIFELPIIVDRPPGYKAYSFIADKFNISETIAASGLVLMLGIGLIFGVGGILK